MSSGGHDGASAQEAVTESHSIAMLLPHLQNRSLRRLAREAVGHEIIAWPGAGAIWCILQASSCLYGLHGREEAKPRDEFQGATSI